jgi:hypothetical protein
MSSVVAKIRPVRNSISHDRRGQPIKPAKQKTKSQKFAEGVGRALRRAADVARKVAKQHGIPIYVEKTVNCSKETLTILLEAGDPIRSSARSPHPLFPLI